jgi:hypothetical protein
VKPRPQVTLYTLSEQHSCLCGWAFAGEKNVKGCAWEMKLKLERYLHANAKTLARSTSYRPATYQREQSAARLRDHSLRSVVVMLAVDDSGRLCRKSGLPHIVPLPS